MFVDIDDVRAELEHSYRETEEDLREEKNMNYRRMLYGMLAGYRKVEIMLHEMEEIYRKQGLEHIRSLRRNKSEE